MPTIHTFEEQRGGLISRADLYLHEVSLRERALGTGHCTQQHTWQPCEASQQQPMPCHAINMQYTRIASASPLPRQQPPCGMCCLPVRMQQESLS